MIWNNFCKKLWKKNNNWNIKRLVGSSLGQTNQHSSVLYIRLTDFIRAVRKLVMDLPSSVDDSQIFVMYDAFLRKIISQIFLGEFMLTLKKLLNIEDLWRHISGPHITFWTFSAVSGVYHAWQSFNNYVDKKKRKGLVESLCLVTQQREGIM